MAKEKLTFMKKWYDAWLEDPNYDLTEQEMAYMIYAAAIYAFEDEKINIGDIFGKEFKGLNYCMSNIYSQMDNIRDYGEKNGAANIKYDAEKIYELKLNNPTITAKDVCLELGYPVEKAKSITSNKGWVTASKIVQKCTDSVQKNVDEKSMEAYIHTDTEDRSVQKCTDSAHTENTESTDSVQKMSNCFLF